MSEFLHEDYLPPRFDHPDAAIRLACVVHRFRVPKTGSKGRVVFADSFVTVGQSGKTRKLMLNADDARKRLSEGCASKKISSERVIGDAKRYIPMVHTILLSCKVQPESARLDHKLVFEWMSGVEVDPKPYNSEAIMFDLTMAVVCEGLGHALCATESSVSGDFALASREYAAAAGIFQYLSKEHIPKWISKGTKVDDATLPTECHAPACGALSTLFMANGQQMAVATLLMREGTPNYSLAAKLCFGVHEQLEDFVSSMRKDSFKQMARMDKEFFTLVTFQINVQKSLSLYFQSRAAWEKDEYGIAIALLSEASVALRTRDNSASHGVPDVTQSNTLYPLNKDLQDLRKHMKDMLANWEKDNSSVYFDSVPRSVPSEKKLREGIQMKKSAEYKLDDSVEPVLFLLPEGSEDRIVRSDSDLARELQERLNAGDDL